MNIADRIKDLGDVKFNADKGGVQPQTALSVGRNVLLGVGVKGVAAMVANDIQRATTIFGACSNIINMRSEMFDRALASLLDDLGVGLRHYAAAAREGQHDVPLQAPPTRSRAMSAAEEALGKLSDPKLPQHAAFAGLPRADRERLTHALKQTVHQPNPSATAVLDEIAKELKDRSLAQAGAPNLDKIEPQSVRRSNADAVATAALVLDVESVIAKARHVRPKQANAG